jgi:hypothetical protein
MKVLQSFLMAVAVASYVPAYAAEDAEALKALVDRQNSICRGGAGGDQTKMEAACDERGRNMARLERMGWCWGPADQPGYLQKWIRCPGQAGAQARQQGESQSSDDARLVSCAKQATLLQDIARWRDAGVPADSGRAFQRAMARAAYLELPKAFTDRLGGLYGDIHHGRMLGMTPNEILADWTVKCRSAASLRKPA